MTNEQTDTALPCIESQITKDIEQPDNSSKKQAIDDKVGFGIEVMRQRRETEPYLQKGLLYTNNNSNHVFAYYKIPHDPEPDEIIDPVFTVLGQDIHDCLRETARSLRLHGEKRTKWEVFPIEADDLARIKSTRGKDFHNNGLSLSVHRTPVTQIAEHYQPEPERTERKKELQVMKKHILKIWPPIKEQNE